MPPPKKPKTGLSRVEEFLTATEKEELACQGSVSSPDCTSPSQTEILASKGLLPIEHPSSLEECLNSYPSLKTQNDYYYNSCFDDKVKRQYNEEPYIKIAGERRYKESENYRSDRNNKDIYANHQYIDRYNSENHVPNSLCDDYCNNSDQHDIQAYDHDSRVSRELLPAEARNHEYTPDSQIYGKSDNYGDITYKDCNGQNCNNVYSSMNVTGKGRLTEMMKARKVDALFHSLQPESPPPSLESLYSPLRSPLSEVRSSPTSSTLSITDQEAPLDFSITAKSVVARMMTEKDCHIQLERSNSPLPIQTPLIHTASNKNKSQRLLTAFLEQPTMPSLQNIDKCDTGRTWLPPSDDTRSLSPGEWRPGMPPFGREQNCDAAPPSSGIHYQTQHDTQLPPMSQWSYHSMPYMPPSGKQIMDNDEMDKQEVPPSGSNQDWQTEDDIMVDKEVISSTSNSDNQKDISSNTTQEQPSSTMEEPKVGRPRYVDKNLSGKRCQICNDMASGFHYGVWSCEGCKAFFKRSLQGTPVDYVCPATNTCTIDKHRRKSCQACRLRKCIEQGMNRGKKGPRGPRGPNKRKHMDNMTPPVPHPEEPQIKIKKEICTEPLPPVPSIKTDDQSIHPLTEYLMKIDPQVRQAGHDNNLPDTELSIMVSLMKLADAELVDVINWAKSIPGYTELELRDRIHLLEACWMEILLMGLLWRSFPHCSDEVLVFAPDLHINRKRADISGMGVLYEKLIGLSNKFASLQIHKEEFVLLRTLVLFNAEVALLPSTSKIDSLREKLIEALQFTSCQRLQKSPERVSHLLLFLPHIRQSSLSAIAHMYTVKKDKAVPGFELLQEMLEARSPIPVPPVMQKRLFDSRQQQEQNSHHQQQHDLIPKRPSNIPASPPLALSVPSHFSHVTSSQSNDSSNLVYRSPNQVRLHQPRSLAYHQHSPSANQPTTTSNNLSGLHQYSYPVSSSSSSSYQTSPH